MTKLVVGSKPLSFYEPFIRIKNMLKDPVMVHNEELKTSVDKTYSDQYL